MPAPQGTHPRRAQEGDRPVQLHGVHSEARVLLEVKPLEGDGLKGVHRTTRGKADPERIRRVDKIPEARPRQDGAHALERQREQGRAAQSAQAKKGTPRRAQKTRDAQTPMMSPPPVAKVPAVSWTNDAGPSMASGCCASQRAWAPKVAKTTLST